MVTTPIMGDAAAVLHLVRSRFHFLFAPLSVSATPIFPSYGLFKLYTDYTNTAFLLGRGEVEYRVTTYC